MRIVSLIVVVLGVLLLGPVSRAAEPRVGDWVRFTLNTKEVVEGKVTSYYNIMGERAFVVQTDPGGRRKRVSYDSLSAIAFIQPLWDESPEITLVSESPTPSASPIIVEPSPPPSLSPTPSLDPTPSSSPEVVSVDGVTEADLTGRWRRVPPRKPELASKIAAQLWKYEAAFKKAATIEDDKKMNRYLSTTLGEKGSQASRNFTSLMEMGKDTGSREILDYFKSMREGGSLGTRWLHYRGYSFYKGAPEKKSLWLKQQKNQLAYAVNGAKEKGRDLCLVCLRHSTDDESLREWIALYIEERNEYERKREEAREREAERLRELLGE